MCVYVCCVCVLCVVCCVAFVSVVCNHEQCIAINILFVLTKNIFSCHVKREACTMTTCTTMTS